MIKRENYHSQDDTFLALSRPSIMEMIGLYKEWELTRQRNGNYCSTDNIKFCNQFNWGWIEFLKARKKILGIPG